MTSLEVNWLVLCASAPRGMGLIPDQGTRIPHAMEYSQKEKEILVAYSLQSGAPSNPFLK